MTRAMHVASIQSLDKPQYDRGGEDPMRACCEDPKVNLDLFKDGVSLFGIPVEILESWIAEAESAK